MTSRALSIRKSSAWQLFCATVKKDFGITVLISIFMLLICPGYTLITINDYLEYSVNSFDFNGIFTTLNTLITVLTCGIAVICCFINFAFMYSKKSGDVYFSLPLTRNGLLISRFFASIVPVMVPIILCYGSMGLLLLSKDIYGDFLRIIIGMLFNILLVIMCCCVTMLFIVCAGSITDLIISFAGLNIGAVAVTFIFFLFCDEILTGFYAPDEGEFLIAASPYLYGFVRLANFAEQGFGWSNQLLIYIVRIVITAAVSIALSLLLFKRRKSEKCTCAYAYRGMYYICGVIVGFICAYIVGLLFGGGSYNIFFYIFGAVGALLGAVTFGLITDRGFKTIKCSFVIGGCSFAAMIALTIVLFAGGFGYTNRLPEVKNVESAEVSFDNVEVTFSNPELIIALHEKAIKSEAIDEVVIAESAELVDTVTTTPDENYKESKSTFIRFEYKMKNGTTMYRSFWVKTKDCADELIAIFSSEENIKYLRDTVESFVSDISIYGYYGEYEESYINTKLTKSEMTRLIEAYIADIPAIAEDVIYCNGTASFYVDSETEDYTYESIDIQLTKDAQNTYALIEELELMERTKQQEEEF